MAKFPRPRRRPGIGRLLLAGWLALVASFGFAGHGFGATEGERQATQAGAEAGPADAVKVTSELFLLTWNEVGAVDVLNLVTIANDGPDQVAEVKLPLAAGSVLLTGEAVGDSGTLEQRERDEVVDVVPLPPGEERNYRLEYRVLIPRLPVTLTRPLLYPTDQQTILTAADELEVLSEDFVPKGTEQLAGRSLAALEARGRPPMEEWRIGLLRPGTDQGLADLPVYLPREGMTGFFWAALGAMAAVAAVTLLARPLPSPGKEARRGDKPG